MDRLKLAALGERLKQGGERLKIGGADMGRKVSGKLKEIIQAQSPETKMVDEATSDGLEGPNWGLNLRICGLLNREEFNGSEVVRAIKKKIAGKNTVSQRLSLDLLEACAMNCDKVFSEVASEKLLDEMVRLIDNPKNLDSNRQRALQLIEAWGKSDDLDYLPVFKQTYMSLKARQVSHDDGNLCSGPGSAEHVASPQRYPYPSMYQQDLDPNVLSYLGGSISEEEKREVLITTRNSIEILSTMLNSETKQKTLKDELTMSMLEECKKSQLIIQRIIESTSDDELKLIEALSLHDELLQILSRYEELEVANQPPTLQDSDNSSTLDRQKGSPSDEDEREQKNSGGSNSESINDSKIIREKE